MDSRKPKQDKVEKEEVLEKENSVCDEKILEENVVEQNNENNIEDNIQDDEANLKKLDEVEQTISKRSSKKKKIINWVFFAANILSVVCILIYELTKEEVVSPTGLEFFVGPFFVLLLIFGLNIFVDTFSISYLMKRNTGKWQPILSYKVNGIGRYYDSKMPLATGGQAFQISYLRGRDIPLHAAISIPMTKMVFQQICWVILSFICMCISFSNPKYTSFVSVISVIGFVLGFIMLCVVIFLSVSKSWGRKFVVMLLKLLQKMKLLKNYEKAYEKIMKTIEDYQTVMRQLAKSPKDFIVMFTSYACRVFLQYSIPYFVFTLFHGFEASLWGDFFIKTVLIDLVVSIIPLPGGVGMSEISFKTLFGHYFTGGTFFWALIAWRFFSYYYYLIQGMCLISYDMFYGNRKYKWLVRKGTLVEESKIFKQEQINKFRAERNRQRRAQNRRLPRSKN